MESGTGDARDEYIAQVTKGRSFAEVGGLWGIVNEKVTVAHRCGATSLAAIDLSPPESSLWSQFRARLQDHGIESCACFSRDICAMSSDGETYEVVHCSGVLYHHPQPMQILTALHRLSERYLILTSAIAPTRVENEFGLYTLPDAGVMFVPALSGRDRAVLAPYWREAAGTALGLTEPAAYALDDGGPWWWLPTSTALEAMAVVAGFRVEQRTLIWNDNALTLLLARS